MDILTLLRALASLGIVLAMIWGGLWLLKRYSGALLTGNPGGKDKTLKILERMRLGQRHTLVKVRDGDDEHLLLLGQTSETVISSKPAHGPEA